MTVALRSEDVATYWTELARRAQVTVLDKRTSAAARLMREGLAALGYGSIGFERYATTIVDPFTNRAYLWLPFEPGEEPADPADAWSLENQAWVGPHEGTHAEDAREMGPAVYALRYADGLWRTRFEQRGIAASQQWEVARTGAPYPTPPLVACLHAYGVGQPNVTLAEGLTDLDTEAVEAGVVVSELAQWTIEFWARRPGVLARPPATKAR